MQIIQELSNSLSNQKKYGENEVMLRGYLEQYKKSTKLDVSTKNMITMMTENLAFSLLDNEKYTEAETVCRTYLDCKRSDVVSNQESLLGVMEGYVESLSKQAKFNEASSYPNQALEDH